MIALLNQLDKTEFIEFHTQSGGQWPLTIRAQYNAYRYASKNRSIRYAEQDKRPVGRFLLA